MTSVDAGEVHEGAETASVRFVRRYDITPAELWEYVTAPQHLSVWITPGAELDGRVGGHVRFPWQHGPAMEGTVTQFDAPRELAYTWREGEAESAVSMRLIPDGEGTLLIVEHTALPLRESRGFAAGWHSHLDWLAFAVTGRARDFDEPARFRELALQYGYELKKLAT